MRPKICENSRTANFNPKFYGYNSVTDIDGNVC